MPASARPDIALRRSVGAAPGPGLISAFAATLLAAMALVLWAGPLLPWARPWLLALPLPVLLGEIALVFSVLALPAFRAEASGRLGPATAGLARGAVLAALILPPVLAARAASPVPGGTVWAAALLVFFTAGGAAAAGAAFGARSLALAAAAVALPALLGFLAADVLPGAGWLSGLSPLVALARADAEGGGWWSGALPGLALLSLAVAAGPRRG